MIKKSEIKRGIDHELEHTSSRRVAKKIAMDHLRERPNYYTKLAKCMPEETVNESVDELLKKLQHHSDRHDYHAAAGNKTHRDLGPNNVVMRQHYAKANAHMRDFERTAAEIGKHGYEVNLNPKGSKWMVKKVTRTSKVSESVIDEGLSSHAKKSYRIADDGITFRDHGGRWVDSVSGKKVAVKFTPAKKPFGGEYESNPHAISDRLHPNVRKAKREINRHMKKGYEPSMRGPVKEQVIDEVSRELLARYKKKAKTDYLSDPSKKRRLKGAEDAEKRMKGWNPKVAKRQKDPMF